MARHLVAVLAGDALREIDRIVEVVVEALAELVRVRDRVLRVQNVVLELVGVRVVRIVAVRDVVAPHEATGVDDVEVADLALDGQRRLAPVVQGVVRLEALHGEVAEPRIDREDTVGPGLLALHDRRHRPLVVEIYLERSARAVGTGRVGVVLSIVARREGVVVHEARDRKHELARLVVDVARVELLPAHEADRRLVRQRDVGKALEHVAERAVPDCVGLHVVAGLEAGRIGLVGDDADRARFRARAEQRPLRPGQRFDARDVVEMDVERTLDCRDRLLVEVDADARQRARVIAVAAARHAAHVDLGEARPGGLVGHARQVLHEVVDAEQVQLLELRGADRLDAEWHVLQALAALGRGDDDVLERSRRRLLLRVGDRHAGEDRGHRRRQRHAAAARAGAGIALAARAACALQLSLPATGHVESSPARD